MAPASPGPAGARVLIERSLELARRAGDAYREATALSNMVHILIDTGDYAAAADAARRAVVADEALDDPWGVAIDRCNLVAALLLVEGPERAFRELVEVAPAAIALGDTELSIEVVEIFGCVWAAFGDAERAATMLGVAEHQRDHRNPAERPGPDASRPIRRPRQGRHRPAALATGACHGYGPHDRGSRLGERGGGQHDAPRSALAEDDLRVRP